MMRRLAIVLSGVALLSGTFLAGFRMAAAMQEPRNPLRLTGVDWGTFAFREKQLYLSGFLAGAAAEQVRALADTRRGPPDSAAVSSRAIDQLRQAKQLRFSYAPAVYAAQIDDFYWWKDHTSIAIVDVVIATNTRMKSE